MAKLGEKLSSQDVSEWPEIVAGAGLTAIKVSAGTTSNNLSAITFSNSNGVSFGINASTMTASHNAITTGMASNRGSDFVQATAGFNGTNCSGTIASNSVSVSIGNYITTAMASNRGTDFVQATAAFAGTSASGTIASNGISVSIGPYITTAMLSNAATISNVRVSGGTTSNLLSAITFADSNGVSWGLNAGTMTATVKTDYLTTAALSNHSHGDPTLALTNLSGTTASASNGFTLSLSAAAPGAGGGFAAQGSGAYTQNTGTIQFANSNGITFGLSTNQMTASHNGLTTAAASDHSHGNPQLNLTNLTGTTASNSAGFTLSLSAANPGGGAGATISAWPPLWPARQTVLSATVNAGGSGGTGGSTQWTYSGRLWPVDIPTEVHWCNLYFDFGIQATSAGTGSASNEQLFGVYSLNANSAMSLLTSYVWSHAMSQNSISARSHRWGWGTNSTSNSTSLGGNVSATFSGSRRAFANDTNNNQTLSTGQWYFCHAMLNRTSNANVFAIVSLAEELGTASTTGYTVFGTNNLVGRPGHWGGVFSTTTNTPAITVTAMPGSIHTSAITLTDNASRWRPVFFQLLRSVT